MTELPETCTACHHDFRLSGGKCHVWRPRRGARRAKLGGPALRRTLPHLPKLLAPNGGLPLQQLSRGLRAGGHHLQGALGLQRGSLAEPCGQNEHDVVGGRSRHGDDQRSYAQCPKGMWAGSLSSKREAGG